MVSIKINQNQNDHHLRAYFILNIHLPFAAVKFSFISIYTFFIIKAIISTVILSSLEVIMKCILIDYHRSLLPKKCVATRSKKTSRLIPATLTLVIQLLNLFERVKKWKYTCSLPTKHALLQVQNPLVRNEEPHWFAFNYASRNYSSNKLYEVLWNIL